MSIPHRDYRGELLLAESRSASIRISRISLVSGASAGQAWIKSSKELFRKRKRSAVSVLCFVTSIDRPAHAISLESALSVQFDPGVDQADSGRASVPCQSCISEGVTFLKTYMITFNGMPLINDTELLRYTLIGLEQHKTELQEKIDDLRQQLGGSDSSPKVKSSKVAKGSTPGKRFVSPEARERMAAAQRKRWATKSAPTEKTATVKRRTMSPEARARIAAAQRKRWAASRKAK